MKNRTLYLIITALCLWFAPGAFCQNTQMSIQDSRNGGVAIKLATVKVTSAYTAKDTDQLVLADTTNAAITVTLPVVTHGRLYTLQNIGTGSYALTVAASSGQTINGSTSYTVSGIYQSITIQGYKQDNSRAWYVVSEQNTPRVQSVTATSTGATTGTILAGTSHATVTCDDANKIVILPAPVVGKQVVIHNGATGYELRSSAPSTIAINGGSGSNAESAIAANSTVVMICVTTTAWKGYFLDADSDLAKV